MKKVKKAVIPAAGFGTRQYPGTSYVPKELFPLVDRDGYTKPMVQIAVEEALAAGVEQVCIIVQPGGREENLRHFRPIPEDLRDRYSGKPWAYEQSDKLEDMGKRLEFVEQTEQEGLGHAVWCARDWVGGEPFLMLLGDHVFISKEARRCAADLVEHYEEGSLTGLSVIGQEDLSRFGIAAGRMKGDGKEIAVDGFVEKPDPDTARRRCSIEGMPEGEYASHFGMHVFSPQLFDVLGHMIENEQREDGEFQLTTAQDVLCRQEPYSAVLMAGERYDIGTPVGLLDAQMALALSSPHRDEVEDLWNKNKEFLKN
jgi:UTP--glucose-1-phosphate uridylyltransferase